MIPYDDLSYPSAGSRLRTLKQEKISFFSPITSGSWQAPTGTGGRLSSFSSPSEAKPGGQNLHRREWERPFHPDFDRPNLSGDLLLPAPFRNRKINLFHCCWSSGWITYPKWDGPFPTWTMLCLNLFNYRALRAWLDEPYEMPPIVPEAQHLKFNL